jgi:hypothetical protein
MREGSSTELISKLSLDLIARLFLEQNEKISQVTKNQNTVMAFIES